GGPEGARLAEHAGERDRRGPGHVRPAHRPGDGGLGRGDQAREPLPGVTMAGTAMKPLTLGGRPMRPRESRVAVLGSGVMGPGIAQVFAEHGFGVALCDPSPQALERARATLGESLDLKIQLGLAGRDAADQVLSRVRMQTDSQEALARADLVVEAVFE